LSVYEGLTGRSMSDYQTADEALKGSERLKNLILKQEDPQATDLTFDKIMSGFNKEGKQFPGVSDISTTEAIRFGDKAKDISERHDLSKQLGDPGVKGASTFEKAA